MFRFANIEMLWLLALVPALVVVYLVYKRARARRLARFGNPATLGGLMPEASPRRVRRKFFLVLASIALIVIALARPQFGSKLKEVTSRGVEILIAVDVSNSMLAGDFEPNRLERTKFAIERLIEQLREDRLGLIVFAGDAYVQLPITSDYVAARNFVRHLSPDMVTRQGTALGAAIDLAALSFSAGSEGSRVLIVVSDGENHEDDPVAAAERAAEQGVTIYTIGMGTEQGAPIPLDGGGYIADEEGNMVVSRLDEAMLERVALAAGGAYIRATNRSVGLEEIVARVAETEGAESTTPAFDAWSEEFPYLLAAALALLIFETLILPRKNRLLARFSVFKK